MSVSRLHQLADDLQQELDEFLTLRSVITNARFRIGDSEPDPFELYAISGILHDLYHGAENICKHIVSEIDRSVPASPASHRELLDQVAKPSPGTRPPVITSETYVLINDYRRFRHVARNVYGFRIDWNKVTPLFDGANTAIETFAADIEKFIAFLRIM